MNPAPCKLQLEDSVVVHSEVKLPEIQHLGNVIKVITVYLIVLYYIAGFDYWDIPSSDPCFSSCYKIMPVQDCNVH